MRTCLIAGVFPALLCLVASTRVFAQDGDTQSRIREFVSAGEFAPALALVEKVGDQETRDQLKQEISVAQYRSGAPLAASTTALGIGDDALRHSTYSGMSQSLWNGGEAPQGRAGGGAMADFQSLISLITLTIDPDSWLQNGEGSGEIQPFFTGVVVNREGVMRAAPRVADAGIEALQRRAAELAGKKWGEFDARAESPVRMISLTRLEKQVERLQAMGQPIPEEMRCLAGLTSVDYVFFAPEHNDIIIAGRAGAWTSAGGRFVNVASGEPVLMLDDLVTVFRAIGASKGQFGCLITPTDEGLKAVQDYSASTRIEKLTGGAKQWMANLREKLGPQKIDVLGIDPGSRVAQAIVAADWHMKRVAIGLEPSVAEVPSYLDTLRPNPDGTIPATNLLRYWFTLNVDQLSASEDKKAFTWAGSAVKVLSENELLSDQGKRVHTGQSDEATAGFAKNFTKHFDALAKKHPVYRDLQNVFEMAMAAAVIKTQGWDSQIGWQANCFGPEGSYVVASENSPEWIESCVNYKEIAATAKRADGTTAKLKHMVTCVSGGVECDPLSKLRNPEFISTKTAASGELSSRVQQAQAPKSIGKLNWWWD
jgi:hypothetical protein